MARPGRIQAYHSWESAATGVSGLQSRKRRNPCAFSVSVLPTQRGQMQEPQSALDFARQHRGAALEDLKEFLRIPSISTLPEHKPDLVRASNWVADQLRQLGLEPVEVLPTAGHPVVYGEWLKSGDSAPTVLVYGHYDVQPVDPLKLWESPPFEPAIRGEDIFARGASDMKGQIVAQLKRSEERVEGKV